MKLTNVSCPPDAWPGSFSGAVALGVLDVGPGVSGALWLVFEVRAGVSSQVWATVDHGSELPAAVVERKPTIIVKAPRNTWELLSRDRATFYRSLETGQVHVSGDFRVFGRYTPALVRLVEGTDLWSRFDTILATVAAI